MGCPIFQGFCPLAQGGLNPLLPDSWSSRLPGIRFERLEEWLSVARMELLAANLGALSGTFVRSAFDDDANINMKWFFDSQITQWRLLKIHRSFDLSFGIAWQPFWRRQSCRSGTGVVVKTTLLLTQSAEVSSSTTSSTSKRTGTYLPS